MRKGMVLAIAATFGLGVATLAVAVPKTRATRGWFSSVDSSANTLKVKGKNTIVTFKLEDNVKVLDNGKPISLAQLKPGEHLLLRYTGLGLNRQVSEVEVIGAAPMHAKATTPAKAPMTKTATKKNTIKKQ